MAGPAPQVGVVGLRALQRDITKACADNGPILKAFQTAGRQAAEPVAAVARGAIPQDSGRLEADIRVTASKSGAAVRMGRASVRYAGWVEFGGTRKTPHTSTRPFQSAGRYLFPAGRRLAGTSAQLYSDALTRALAGLGWTNPDNTAPGSVHD